MLDAIAWSELIDVGFVVLVSFVAIRSLMVNTREVEEKSSLWKQELLALEKSLGRLIEEAAEESRKLDRNLLKRKEELTVLLEQLQQQTGEIPAQPSSSQPTISLSENDALDDFPNETWVRKPTTTATIEPVPPAPEGRISKKEKAKRLAKQIEVARATAQARAGSTDENVVAQRIAKRLLSQGQEIHIVARKLNLDVSTVRALDAQIKRAETTRNSAPQIETSVIAEKPAEFIPEDTAVPNLLGENFSNSNWALE